jgi:hypothetical protein
MTEELVVEFSGLEIRGGGGLEGLHEGLEGWEVGVLEDLTGVLAQVYFALKTVLQVLVIGN